MSRRPFLTSALALVIAAASAATAPAQSDVPAPVSPIASPTPIASYRGHLVFSRRAADGRFELVQRTGDGPVVPVGVPPRSVPFDVDVGPTNGGRILAVYTRCTTEPKANGGEPHVTEYQMGRGCDVYKVDLGGGRETRYSKVSAGDGTEFWPTYWKGRVGFARVYDDQRDHPYIYVKTVASGRPSQRIPGGPRRQCSGQGGRRRCSDDRRSVPQALELYGTRLAFAWRFQGLGEGPDYDLRLDTVGGGHRLMDHVNNGGLTAVPIGWPSFEGGRLFWSRGCFYDTSGCRGRERLVKSTYAGAIIELEATAPRPLLSHERDELMTVVVTDQSNVADCQGDPPKPMGTCAVTYSRPDFHPGDR
jgi:hypothetical protein